MTEQPDDPARFGSEIAAHAAAALQREGLGPDGAQAIGDRAIRAIQAAAHHRREQGMPDEAVCRWVQAASDAFVETLDALRPGSRH
jgi:hypothetical protein